MKKILLVLLVLLSSNLYAREYINPFGMYGDNYFIAGNTDDQVKFRLGINLNLWLNSGLYFAYSQVTWWKIYDGADTMSANYMPEVYYQKNIDFGPLDYIKISPFMHTSTGVEGADHRSINIYYAQTQISAGKIFKVGDNIKLFGYYTKAEENPDIDKYKGYFENDLFFKWCSIIVPDMSHMELHLKHGGSKDKGWFCTEFRSRFIGTDFQPKLFMQYFYGYGENIVYYNKKGHSLYIGLIL